MDDLLDLDWKQPSGNSSKTSQASTSAAANRNAGTTNLATTSRGAGNGTGSGNTSSYNFDSLTRSLYAASPAASVHSNYKSQPALQPTSSAKAPPPPPSSSADAFSSLLSFASTSGSQTSSLDGKLTLAERQRKAQEEAQARAASDQRQQETTWAGLDSGWDTLDRSNAINTTIRAGSPASSSVLRPPAPATTAIKSSRPTATPGAASADLWDFGALSESVPTRQSSKKPPVPVAPPSNDPFDLDAFETAPAAPQAQNTPQFGGLDDNTDDDILGALGKPVEQQQSRSQAGLHLPRGQPGSTSRSSTASSALSSRQPSPASGSRPNRTPRAVSPPPHILGQIVEMGFSPQEARKALAQTESGLNVEAALELLVTSGDEPNSTNDEDQRLAQKLQRQEADRYGVDRDEELQAYEAKEAERRRQRRIGPSRDTANLGNGAAIPQGPHAYNHGNTRQPSRSATPSSQPGSSEWQQQADQLYAQASEIGANMLGKATAFWSSAKAQAQKALEDRQRAAAAAAAEGNRGSSPAAGSTSDRARALRWGAGAGIAAGRKEPKWMVEAQAAAEAEGAETEAGRAETPADGGFKDSDDEGEIDEQVPRGPSVPPRPAAQTREAVKTPSIGLWDDDDRADTSSTRQPPPAAASKPLGGLAAPQTEAKRPYVSPNRRGPTRPAAAAAAAAVAIATVPDDLKTHRQITPDDPGSVSSSSRHKSEGNEHFKKGAYGEAEACYTRGIDALVSGSLRLVPLLNNRANARLKNGSAATAAEDCNRVLSLIMPQTSSAKIYRPSTEHPLPSELGNEVNLRDGYAKALLRKAQALEALEKWSEADQVWTLLLDYEKREGSGAGGVNNMRFARDGAVRCGKMLGRASEPGSTASSSSTAPRRPTGPAAAPGSRLAAHKAQQAAQDSESTARLSLKDTVDTKLTTWKGGKETNLRALIASVDTLAWDGLGWQKVGMHQLVTDAQVKKAYMKAVARVHPDKLTPNNTTLEQRMLAAGIFNALNEAWNAQSQ